MLVAVVVVVVMKLRGDTRTIKGRPEGGAKGPHSPLHPAKDGDDGPDVILCRTGERGGRGGPWVGGGRGERGGRWVGGGRGGRGGGRGRFGRGGPGGQGRWVGVEGGLRMGCPQWVSQYGFELSG